MGGVQLDISQDELKRAIAKEAEMFRKFYKLMDELTELIPYVGTRGRECFVLSDFFKAMSNGGSEFEKGIFESSFFFANLFYSNQPENKIYRKKKITDKTKLKVFARDGYRCQDCFTNSDLSIDHIIPESKGGSHDLENLQTLCLWCNRKKGVNLPNEYYPISEAPF